MKLNVSARLFVPSMLMWIGGSNPPIAGFEGEHNLEITTPLDFEKFLQRVVHFSGCNFSIVSYEVEKNRLTLRAHAPSDTLAGAKEFITQNIENSPGWKVYHDTIDLYERHC
jgi:hypothetical protein